jgi:hypothetical protein
MSLIVSVARWIGEETIVEVFPAKSVTVRANKQLTIGDLSAVTPNGSVERLPFGEGDAIRVIAADSGEEVLAIGEPT